MSDRQGNERDAQEIRELLERYQTAHKERDRDTIRACVADGFFRSFGCGSNDPMDWVPGVYLSGTRLDEWASKRAPDDAVYEEQHQIRKIDVHGNLAMSVLQSSGSWRGTDGQVYGQWTDVDTVWYTARIDDRWLLVAAFFPESSPYPS